MEYDKAKVEKGREERERERGGAGRKRDEESNPFSPTREKLIIHRVERSPS